MKPTRTRLAGVAAVMATIAIAAPVSTAGAATTTTPVPRLTGPTYITTAPTTFVNNNNQVSAADTSSGSQVAP